MFDQFLNFFDKFQLFDLVYLALTILSLIKCSSKGFVLSILSASKWLFSYVVALYLFPKAKPFVEGILDNEYVITAIHEYVPKLPWGIYKLTQAKLHLYVMKKFEKELKSLKKN